jgi:hypothetical protein
MLHASPSPVLQAAIGFSKRNRQRKAGGERLPVRPRHARGHAEGRDPVSSGSLRMTIFCVGFSWQLMS